ncbi:MAG: hypothetical protein NT018_08160 [Armatimonadetes bacterium]|nr:hypothetical protein [Armatimonadota bacterium]
MFVVLVIVIVIACLWFALKVAMWVQNWLDKDKKRSQKANSSLGWLGHIHWIIGSFGGAIAGLKYIYQAWQTAPYGSLAKFGWGALLAIIIAVGLLVIIRLIDQRVNGQEAPVYTQNDDLAAQIAIRQMGEKIDPINR